MGDPEADGVAADLAAGRAEEDLADLAAGAAEAEVRQVAGST